MRKWKWITLKNHNYEYEAENEDDEEEYYEPHNEGYEIGNMNEASQQFEHQWLLEWWCSRNSIEFNIWSKKQRYCGESIDI